MPCGPWSRSSCYAICHRWTVAVRYLQFMAFDRLGFPWAAGLETGLSKSSASLPEGKIASDILLNGLAKSVG